MSRRPFAIVLVLAVACACACGACSRHAAAPASTLTESQRDSVLGRSSLPGASAIGRAQQAAGLEAGHAAGVDSTAK